MVRNSSTFSYVFCDSFVFYTAKTFTDLIVFQYPFVNEEFL
jgi:hypothetical protein